MTSWTTVLVGGYFGGGGAQAIRALGVLGGGAQGGATAVLPSLTLGPGIRFGKSEA